MLKIIPESEVFMPGALKFYFAVFSITQKLIFIKFIQKITFKDTERSKNIFTCCSIEFSLLNKTIFQESSYFIYKVLLCSALRTEEFCSDSTGVNL